MKKFWSKLTVLLCLLAGFGVVFSGCSDGGSKKKKTNPTVDTEPSGISVPDVVVSSVLTPDNGATAAYEDSSLYIKFDSVPVVDRSSSGTVKIYKASDDSLVDTIKPADEKLTVVPSNASYTEVTVKDQLISVSGNVVVIKPHAVLDNETEYYVIVDNGLISGTLANSGAMLSDPVSGSSAFAGITSKTAWKFTTRAAPTISENKISIGKDKDFSTIQAGLNYLYGKSGDWTMEIDAGYYNERLTYAGSANLTMIGVDETEGKLGESTVVYWANCNLWSPSTRQRASFLWEGGDLTLKHLTFANTVDRSVVGKDGTQAETLYYDAKGKVVAYDCSFKSHQDTLLLGNNGGRGWFYKCYIEGDTDFIWGYGDTMLFEECQIRCLYDSAPAVTTHTSYIFASRTVQTNPANKGFVLFNSKVSVDDGVTAYYGRNSGSDTQAAVVFNTFETIDSKLWAAGATKYDEDVSGVCSIGYKDYGNVYEGGSVIDTSDRLEGAYGLSKEVAEREFCGRNAILNRGWNASTRKYVAVSDQWDLSAFETEFDATEDASKSMIYLEPTYVPYLQGSATQTFEATNYKGETVDVTLAVSGDVSAAGSDPLTATTLGTVEGMTVTASAGVNGTATVTATKEGMSGIAQIVVIKQIVPATSASLAWDEELATANTIEVGDTKTVTVTYAPTNLTDDATIWSSSNTNVVRVTGSGALNTGTSASVFGFGAGTATITATNKATNTVSASIEVTVKDVYYVSYFDEAYYTQNASTAHRDITVVAEPASYGFAGGVAVKPATSEIQWGNNGWPFTSADTVSNEAGTKFAWADYKIRAAGGVTLKAIDASLYCSATSNERGIVYVSKDNGTTWTQLAEVAADSKQMTFSKVAFSEEVALAAGESAIIRTAIANIEGKTVSKAITGVIGNVKIYYEITGTAVKFPGADGTYNILDYATAAEKVKQGTAIADGSSADGMVSWHNVTYHSENYGLQILGTTGATITIKVGGPSVIQFLSSEYSGGTVTVTNAGGDVIASGSTKTPGKDSDTSTRILSFLYTGAGEDTLTLAFTGSTSYIGPITVYELTTEKAEVTSVKINGAETVSTAAPVKFTATVKATYMASPEVVWSSSDETIATVAADGTVTGKKAGTVTIKATSAIDSTKSDSVEVTIIEEELKPVVGTTYTYNFADQTTATTDKTAGTSSDTFVSWNDLWKYHGAKYGIQNTSNSASEDTAAKLTIKVAGDVVVGFTGYNAANGVMKVTDAEGNVVVANMPMGTGSDSTTKWFIYKGEATTLTLTNLSGTTYIATLTVKPWTDEVPAVTAVSASGAGSVAVGQTVTLKADVTASYFADESVTWSSGDDSIATVDENGVVTGVAAGSVTITATSVNNPAISGSKTVKVSADANNPIYGYTYSYTLTGGVGTPYTSDDGFLKVTANGDNGGHGLIMKDGNTVVLKVAGAGTISLIRCKFDNSATITLTNSSGTVIDTKTALAATENDGDATDFTYSGAADTLTFTYSAGTGGHYLHGVKFTPASNSVTYTLTGGVGTPFTSDDGNLKVTANGDNGGHGLIMKDGNTVELKVAGAATISLIRCKFDNSATITLTNSSGTVIDTKAALAATENDGDATDFTYSGAADTLTFTYSAGTGGHYLHGVTITY